MYSKAKNKWMSFLMHVNILRRYWNHTKFPRHKVWWLKETAPVGQTSYPVYKSCRIRIDPAFWLQSVIISYGKEQLFTFSRKYNSMSYGITFHDIWLLFPSRNQARFSIITRLVSFRLFCRWCTIHFIGKAQYW